MRESKTHLIFILFVTLNFAIKVGKEEDMEKVFKKAKEKFGRVDILVNCAGFVSAYCTLTMKGVPFDLDKFSKVMEVQSMFLL